MGLGVTDHVVVGIEHPIPPNVTNVRVVPGTVQSIPDVDKRVRVPHVAEVDEFGDVEIYACGRSRVIQYKCNTRGEDSLTVHPPPGS